MGKPRAASLGAIATCGTPPPAGGGGGLLLLYGSCSHLAQVVTVLSFAPFCPLVGDSLLCPGPLGGTQPCMFP